MKNLICAVGVIGILGFGSLVHAGSSSVQVGDEIFYKDAIAKVTGVDGKGRIFISQESNPIDTLRAYKVISSCGGLEMGSTGKLVVNGMFFNMSNIRPMESLAMPGKCHGTAVAEDAAAQSLVNLFSADDVIVDSTLTAEDSGIAVGETGYCFDKKFGARRGQVASIYKKKWLILENVEHTVQKISVACRQSDYFTIFREIDVNDSRNSIFLKDQNGNALLRVPYAKVVSQGRAKYRLKMGQSDVLIDAEQVLNMDQVKSLSQTRVPGYEQGKRVIFSSEKGGIRRGQVISAEPTTKIVFVEITDRRDTDYGRVLPKFMSSLALEN